MAQLLTVRAVAAQLAVSRSSVYKMLEGGVFPQAPIRLPNGSPRWPQVVVDEWVEAHRCDNGERAGHCRVLAGGESER
ncbi:MAG: AlpA family phage regulatory protein [Acidobacteria bacterium]|nr:AlpA family phage regulatory protein [Acidobacteriota bacterium]